MIGKATDGDSFKDGELLSADGTSVLVGLLLVQEVGLPVESRPLLAGIAVVAVDGDDVGNSSGRFTVRSIRTILAPG